MLKTSQIPSEPNKALIFLLERIISEVENTEVLEFSSMKHSSLRHLVELLSLAAMSSSYDIMEKVEKLSSCNRLRNAWLEAVTDIYRVFQLKQVEDNFRIFNKHEKFNLNRLERDELIIIIKELRNKVTLTEFFTDEHRGRLLNKISEIEQELYKRNGTLQTVVAALDTIGRAFGKFGKDVKPLTDRIAEITGRASDRSESNRLPPPDEVKRLPAPEKVQEVEQS